MATTLRPRPLGSIRYLLSCRTTFNLPVRYNVSASRTYATSDALPKIADRSVWTSMIPKFIRNRKARDPKKSKEWNPATFYIVMFTLIGSQAIRMLSLKNSYATYSRTTDAKIRLLREVIERVKNGEEVDVERILGTGNKAEEREWEEVMQEIEKEDALWRSKNSKVPLHKVEDRSVETQEKDSTTPSSKEPAIKTESKRKVNFF
ncbi:hypothetical protein N7468_003344 [Penicillium chermesinum]|uniref:Uncharacterized protein n=1 Tax=Penicillium chermesinum TaxID=63820 RepID=A0A9W9P6T5_9EURO|nr:uncharacterized protein N7468_003344 [Penicillium chermesinum]KAJ5238725.1 hypothetical protein N7468_003344 [Penicillium chermesinum]KAJ6164371.1 hypothetical protein N7470_003043 [Penicillium chermesinum]